MFKRKLFDILSTKDCNMVCYCPNGPHIFHTLTRELTLDGRLFNSSHISLEMV